MYIVQALIWNTQQNKLNNEDIKVECLLNERFYFKTYGQAFDSLVLIETMFEKWNERLYLKLVLIRKEEPVNLKDILYEVDRIIIPKRYR